MAVLRIEIPITVYSQENVTKLQDFFHDFSMPAQLLDEDVVFELHLTINERIADQSTHEYKVYVSLSTEITGIADIDKNLFCTGKICKHTYSDRDGQMQTVEWPGNYELDELISEDVKDIAIGFVMAMILGDPSIDAAGICVTIYIDEVALYRKILLQYNMHNQAVWEYPSLFTEQVSLQQSWEWINKNTSIYGKYDKSPMYFSALTYMLARDYHEAVLYGVIGLENIYATKNEKGILERLKKRIPLVLPAVEIQQIKDLYRIRSDVVHGKMQLGICFSWREIYETDDVYEKQGVFATALLLASIRKLIVQNATTINFTEKVEHSYE